MDDEAPSVKSAACRAIGVLASFSQIVYKYLVNHLLLFSKAFVIVLFADIASFLQWKFAE